MSLISMQMFFWLAGTTVLVWIAPRIWQPLVIALITSIFLAWQSFDSFVILSAATLLCYFLSCKDGRHKSALVFVVVTLSVTLAWYKWDRSLEPSDPAYIMIPLGLSYYALRLIHYIVERWKGTIPDHTLSVFIGYLFFLPTLIAGPINRFPEYCRSLRRRRWDPALFSRGCERILYGAVKVVFLGNFLVSEMFANYIDKMAATSPRWTAYLDCVQYGANLYFQFSGYSDIAIGFALLLGFEVAENFNYPFLARNINDFWKRWHMTLSGWCRDYVYMPVLATSRSPRLGIIAAMLVLGVWHEFSLRYLVWGGYHGLGIACWQRFQLVKGKSAILSKGCESVAWVVLAWFVTINFVVLSFAFTKQDDVSFAVKTLKLILFGS